MNADGELVPGEHPALIDRGAWDAVQAVLDSRPDQEHPQGRNVEYLLAGLLRCTACGLALTPSSTKPRGGESRRYYACLARSKRGADSCPSKPWPATALEAIVVERIRTVTADGALAVDVAARLTERLATERATLQAERRRQQTALDRLERDLEKAVASLPDLGPESRAATEERIARLRIEQQQARGGLADLADKVAAVEAARVDVDWVAQALTDWGVVFEHMSPANKQRLVRALVRQVLVDPVAGTLTATLVDISVGAAS